MKMKCVTTLFTAFALVCVSTAVGQEKKNDKDVTITDPAKAGPDYAVQGEYVGQLAGRDGKVKLGVQVIALGGGKFRAVAHGGGLPGDGWNGEGKIKADGETKGSETVFDSGEGKGTGTVKDGELIIRDADGNEVGRLKKTARKSSTLGAKPPKGALVLFDGKDAKHFKGGKMTADKLLMANCESNEKWNDHVMHLEFRTPFKPFGRGQGRGNSGVYIHARYECQVLDSFGLEGENDECGGIYSIAKPKVNACFPPLTWQTYDIEFKAAKYEEGKKVKNARVTIRHNGILIHDDLELPKGTPGKHPEGPEPQGLYLQGHGNPVVYRNIWVVKK